MSLQYVCTNRACSYPGSTAYQITFKTESILDPKNIAANFCPFCKKEMTPRQTPDVIASSEPAKSNSLTQSGEG